MLDGRLMQPNRLINVPSLFARFGQQGELSLRYAGPYKIMQCIGAFRTHLSPYL